MTRIARAGFLTLVLAASASSVEAVPLLQLDIGGGTYDPSTGTIVATSDPFTLYAILTPQGQGGTSLATLLNQWYFVSAAIEPPMGPPGSNIGSFSFQGTSYSATSGMTYGNPPLDVAAQLYDSGDLAPHGQFPTYYSEFAFCFGTCSLTQLGPSLTAGTILVYPTLGTSGVYNTADTPGGPIAGTGSYYAAFTIDTTLLNQDNILHFDLYSEAYLSSVQQCQCTVTDIDVNQFAPFTHDAESRQVPEPSSLALVLTGLLTFAGAHRKLLGLGRGLLR